MEEGIVMASTRVKTEEAKARLRTPRPQKPQKPQPSKGEQHVGQRQRAKAMRDRARAQAETKKHTGPKGITPASIKADTSLNDTEKKRILSILEKAKGRHEG